MTTQVERLKQFKIQVKGHLGQHILIDPHIPLKIVELLEIKPNDFVLEIGPGLGVLTDVLLQKKAKVLAVEKDKRFVHALEKIYENEISSGQLSLQEGDFLKWDLGSFLTESPQHLKVVSNLPYYITAPCLMKIFDHHPSISRAVFMMQKEVADRLVAQPGTKTFGRLSLRTQYVAYPQRCFTVTRKCFTPPPEVASAVVCLNFKSRQELNVGQEKKVFELIGRAFQQRRKKLVTVLASKKGGELSRERLEAFLIEQGHSKDVRAERLALEDWIALIQKLIKV